jgi:hypothetical protein
MVNELKPGIVYEIDNDIVTVGSPRPIYRIVAIED